MDDKVFEQIRINALENIMANCPPEKRNSVGSKLYEQQLVMASRVCLEMLKEYHKAFELPPSSE